jgi:peptide subunit release factor 1 (eRF1)
MHRPQSRSLALFVNETGSLWWHEFDVPIATDVRWGETAFIQPFIEAMDESKTYAVVLVNRSRARILTVNMANIVERAKLQSNNGIRHIKTTGTDRLYSQSHFQRRADEHALSSFKNVVEALERIAIAHPFERLILSGSTQAATEVFRLLSKPLRAKVIAFATIPVGASDREILERTMEVERDAERAFELGRIEALITAAAKGTGAVTGTENTLKALTERRVHELVYAEGFSGDVVERALNLALSENANIEQVRGDAAARLKTAGGIGAFVRWDS